MIFSSYSVYILEVTLEKKVSMNVTPASQNRYVMPFSPLHLTLRQVSKEATWKSSSD